MSRANSNSSRAPSGAASGKDTEECTEESTRNYMDESTVSLIRIDRLRNSMPGKDSLIDELIDLFVCDLPKRLRAITQAVERDDAPDLTLQAHALRGGAANFGAIRLDGLCGTLEEIGVRGKLAEAPATLGELTRESARVRDALLALKQNGATKPAAAPAPSRRSRSV